MSQLLAPRQAEELCVSNKPLAIAKYLLMPLRHKAIVAYLTSINHLESAARLKEDLNLSSDFDEATSKKYEGILEKKWTGVVRLQKKACRPNLPFSDCAKH